jgi:predicted RNase H-like HicB family nuclease
MKRIYEVSARWDSEAAVWVAESQDVPGLVTEADSPNALVQKLRSLIPDLLEANGVLDRDTQTIEFHVRYQHEESGVAVLAS